MNTNKTSQLSIVDKHHQFARLSNLAKLHLVPQTPDSLKVVPQKRLELVSEEQNKAA